MDRFVRILNLCCFIMIIFFIPIILLSKLTIVGEFVKLFAILVVCVVGEHAAILTMKGEILDVRPDNKIFRFVKLNPFLRWFVYDYDRHKGNPLLTVCLQYLFLPAIVWWIGCFLWLIIQCLNGSFLEVVDAWRNIQISVILAFAVPIVITNLTRLITLIYFSRKYPKAGLDIFFTKMNLIDDIRSQKEFKEVVWRVKLSQELKKIVTRKYKGHLYVCQKDLDKLEVKMSQKYPKAKMERVYDEKGKYIWRVYSDERTLFQALIRK